MSPNHSSTGLISSRKSSSYLRALAALIAVSFADNSAFAVTQTSTWAGGISTLWSNANNWSPNTAAPSNGNAGSDYNVIIGVSTVLDITVTIDALTVNTGGILQTNAGTNFTINGPTLTNNGTIVVNTNENNSATALVFGGNTILSGNGTLSLNDNGNPAVAQITSAANVTLTQSSNHNTHGRRRLPAAFINNGTVNANVANTTLVLQSNAMTNNNLFEATTGSLNINSITVTQGAAGQISAAGGTVNINSSTISGGTLASSGGGLIQISGSSTIVGLTNTSNALHILPNANVKRHRQHHR